MTPEGKVKVAIKKWLKSQGAYFFMPVPTGYGRKSIDFFVCLNGWFVGIETKRPGVHEGTALQEIELQAIRDAGGIAFVAQSLADVTSRLRFAK